MIYYRLGWIEFFVYVYDYTEVEIRDLAQLIIDDIKTFDPSLKDLVISASFEVDPINDFTKQYHVY